MNYHNGVKDAIYLFQAVGDAQIKAVQRLSLHQSGGRKGLAEKHYLAWANCLMHATNFLPC